MKVRRWENSWRNSVGQAQPFAGEAGGGTRRPQGQGGRRGNEEHAGGIGEVQSPSSECDLARGKRLAERVEGAPAELVGLVEEQDAGMREAELTGSLERAPPMRPASETV
jgi:hypothetical protein